MLLISQYFIVTLQPKFVLKKNETIKNYQKYHKQRECFS